MTRQYDVCVVGGGAAGLLCAATAAGEGARTVVAEKMPRPARKLLITGKGRCNLCNNCTEDEFIAAMRSNPKFLYSAYNAFPCGSVMDLFQGLGVPLKTERGRRVFPQSDRAVDVVDALVRHAGKSGAHILTETPCSRLLLENGRVAGIETGSGGIIRAGAVVVATGGVSYPGTGSTGDGYRLAAQAGHTITDRLPSLVPVVTREAWVKDVMGLSLRNVAFVVTRRKKGGRQVVFSGQGELLFTHFGLSGPLVLSASAHMRGALEEYRMHIDLKPALSREQLDVRIRRDFSSAPNRDFKSSLGELLPRSLIPVAASLSGIPGETKVNQITREQRMALGGLLKELPLTPKGLRPIEEAVVTAGGVEVGKINPRTMESRLTPGLYFAGEVLDVDAYTGGYNLQIAFSTGYLAGTSAAAAGTGSSR